VHEAFQMRAAHATRQKSPCALIRSRRVRGRGADDPDGRADHSKNRVYMGYAYRGEHANRSAHPPIVTAGRVAGGEPRERAGRPARQGTQPARRDRPLRGVRYVLGAPGERTSAAATSELPLSSACTRPAPVRPTAERRCRQARAHVESLWREQMAAEAVAVQHDSKGLQDASEQLSLAEEELSAFAADKRRRRRLLGSGYHPALEERTAAVSRAQAQLNVPWPAPARGERRDLRGAHDRGAKAGARSSIDAVIVGRGHSAFPIEQRVIDPLARRRAADLHAAEREERSRSGPTSLSETRVSSGWRSWVTRANSRSRQSIR